MNSYRIILICVALLTLSACDKNSSDDILPNPEQAEQLEQFELAIASDKTMMFEGVEYVRVITDAYDYDFEIASRIDKS